MISSIWFASIALAGLANAVQDGVMYLHARQVATTGAPPLPELAEYNITIPVDHFTPSDKRTYNNRFFVNDTYYKSGGPVILCDNGEAGLDPLSAAFLIAEYDGTSTACLRLASKLNGVAIAWEHRYYGYSQPVSPDLRSAVPSTGAAGYKYLTVEQALEDLVYFANNFNKTTLDLNSNIQSTANLDPYHTPWIFVGGSYPGSRAAWTRIRNPEIFYATWSSSAPVEVVADGSSYWNQVSRALPSNCTKDLKAISTYVDQVFTSGTPIQRQFVQIGALLAQNPKETNLQAASTITAIGIQNMVARMIDWTYQLYGPAQTFQHFCNYMEEFDAEAYITALSNSNVYNDVVSTVRAGILNRGGASYPTSGLVAANGDRDGPQIGFAAFTRAYYQYALYRTSWETALPPKPQYTYDLAQNDINSWNWQTLVQTGWYQYTNQSTQWYTSKYNTPEINRQGIEAFFPTFRTTDFPAAPNVTGPESLGGWNMRPSNVMFTNGEFDQWRAFSVASIEDNAPKRKTTNTIPKCNTPPSGTDAFGIVYSGAVHCEDMLQPKYPHKGSEQTPRPQAQGVDLFVRAYNAWQPCFNQSRDDMRNGRGVDGQGTRADGTSSDDDKNAAGKLVAGSAATRSVLLLTFVSVLFAFW